MSRLNLPLLAAGSVVLIVTGLSLGCGGSRRRGADAGRPIQGNAPSEMLKLVQATAAQVRTSEADPAPAAHDVHRLALLVGITKYDHLPERVHLTGPANDVRLMRTLLTKRFRFPAEGIVALTEDEGRRDRRPTRANIAREFRRLADQAGEGDQILILLSGHGDRQPESDPPDPRYPEPDGIDEIFLPADVKESEGSPKRVHNAIIDNEIGDWLRAITAKKAYVWIIFDCCHSGTMTRGVEVVRELPPDTLMPREELEKARQRAARRQGKTRGGSSAKSAPFVPQEPSDYLVAVYACRPQETTPECPQPADSRDAKCYGLLTYNLVDILTKSAESPSPLTYRELVQRLQIQYAGRPQGSPTPLVEGRGQDRVVLGTEQPLRSPLLLSRDEDGYKVNAGALHGLTSGSILAVESPAGGREKPKLLGHVRVQDIRPFDATVEPCADEESLRVEKLPLLSTCRPVLVDYSLRRFKVAVQVPDGQAALRQRLRKAVQSLAEAKEGLVEYVEDPRQAQWLVRPEKGKLQLVEASGNREPFALPDLDNVGWIDALRHNLEKVYRARNLLALAGRFEGQRYRGSSLVGLDVEVLGHKNPSDRGEVLRQPAEGWVFRPGDRISFRIHNKSRSPLDVTLLTIGADFQIEAFYPKSNEAGKTVPPGRTLDTPPPHGEVGDEPPFGPEHLVVIATPATNPPMNFTALAQDGLRRARTVDRSQGLRSPLGQLLEHAMYRSGARSVLIPSFAEQHGMRVLKWRTEPK